MFDYPIALIDLETTGLRRSHDRVIEVGICLVNEGQLVQEWHSLVNPGIPIPPFIRRHTGICDDMVCGAPSFADLNEEIFSRIDGRVLVAHNAAFDYGFLHHEFSRCGRSFHSPCLCTVKLSRSLYPRERRHGLDALIERFDLPCHARHRALDDARLLWHLLQAFFIQQERPKVFNAARSILEKKKHSDTLR